jgi:uncharacterized protein (DUF433 family)
VDELARDYDISPEKIEAAIVFEKAA